ncbi:hypothetical protein K504DRAFT_432453 [Pleomassaria siparia CBS 279.74]|uniref:Uncharacterized protein n=1 Tax=Pleomassaria siparia CBS 279.74 TaxID=1314801 RepID=A0A6G1KAT5_9PLEO|nr:hypothetical protein K504DRAFT_432453 [Pleomassaria siparia CBS 279.74]
MSPAETVQKGKKRARNGKEIESEQPAQSRTRTRKQMGNAQGPAPTPKNRSNQTSHQEPKLNRPAKGISHTVSMPKPKRQKPERDQHPTQQPPKLPRLPSHAIVTTRPLHRPALPTPFSSSTSPKTVYITKSTPFIPCVKRVRSLLDHIASRAQQSALSVSKTQLQANGRLDPRQVERSIAEAAGKRDADDGDREEVYLKASGKAIHRALEIGVYFQKEADCRVRVEIGSVRAIDDIELGEKEEEEEDADEMEVDGGEGAEDKAKEVKKSNRRRRSMRDEDVPETRIRTLSVVTVAISLR